MGQASTSARSGLSYFLLAGDPNERWFGEPDSEALLGNGRLGFGGVPGNYPLPTADEWADMERKKKEKGGKGEAGPGDMGEPRADGEEELQVGENDRNRSRTPPRRGFAGQASSKLRALITGAWWSPKRTPSETPSTWRFPLSPFNQRKETPALVKVKGGTKPKDKLERALAVARSLKAKQCKTPPIVKFFDANSSKHSKDAKRRTTLKILEELVGEGRAMPLDVDLLLNFASSLKEGGYTAGDGYLIEAKLLHVEGGHGWNEQLDRCFKQCKRALTRGKGPSKKAPEVELHQREKPLKPNWGKTAALVKFGVELFLFAMTWMLRELELVCMDTKDVFFDHTRKKVTITINTSKMDPEAKGVKRTLQCLCTGAACERECPFSVSYKLVTLVESFNGTGSMLALKKDRKSPSKYAVVNTWRAYLGPYLTGHSARRTGALKYICEGWSVSQVAHLGRWKSTAILLYAEEALETMPANVAKQTTDKTAETDGGNVNLAEFEEYKAWTSKLKEEVKVLKRMTATHGEELEKAAEMWQNLETQQEGTLPTKVLSLRTKVVHLNMAKVAASPTASWRTMCGWHYYGNNFVFDKEMAVVSCQKCQTFCAKQ